MKPGYKTSELWLTVVSAIGMIAVAFGALTEVEVNSIVAAITQAVTAVGALYVAVKPVVAYIESRADVKSAKEYNKKA